MAANQAPIAPCLLSEAVVYRLACSAGTSTMAPASSVTSHACARRGWLTQLMTTPQKAAITITPVQDQKWAMTVSGELVLGARSSVVTSMPYT